MRRSIRSHGGRSGPERLLSRARQLAASHDLAGLCALSARFDETPTQDQAALALLVGGALCDAFRSQEALDLYDRALRTDRPARERAELQLHRARTYLELFQMKEAEQALEQAGADLDISDGTELSAQLHVLRATLLSSVGDQQGACDLCQKCLVEYERPEFLPVRVEALLTLALAALRRGNPEDAVDWAERAVERTTVGLHARHADALRTLAVARANQSEFMQAVVLCQRALRFYREHGSPRGLFRGYLSLGICYLDMGELDHAELFLGRCLDLAESGEDLPPRSQIYSRMGRVYLARGAPAEALKLYRRDHAINQKLGNPLSRGHPELNLAQAHAALHDLPQALVHLDQALRHFSEVGDLVNQVRTQLLLVRLKAHLALKDGTRRPALVDEAGDHLMQARRLSEPLGRPELEALGQVARAFLFVAQGDIPGAMTLYREGASVLDRLEEVTAVTHLAFDMGRLLEAASAVQPAVEIYSDSLRQAELHQFHDLRRQLLMRLDRLDENAVVDRSLNQGLARSQSSRDLLRRPIRPEDILGETAAIRTLRREILQVARTEVPVLIQGETGTGKELVARAIHFASPVEKGPLIPINCGAIPRDLVESELFGHARGAFTNAVSTHVGCLERAHRGTIFLDEIGDLPLDAQVKLLRFLTTGEVRKVGETRSTYVEVRVVAATYHDLRQAVAQGRFREDLYYRLAIFELRTPSLRERPSDILLLAQHFLCTMPLALERGIRGLSPSAQEAFTAYHWPGNVRELENAILRACVVCTGDRLMRHHLPESVQSGPPVVASAAPPVGKDQERQVLLEALERMGWHLGRTASLLGIHRNTLTRRMARLGIDGNVSPGHARNRGA